MSAPPSRSGTTRVSPKPGTSTVRLWQNTSSTLPGPSYCSSWRRLLQGGRRAGVPAAAAGGEGDAGQVRLPGSQAPRCLPNNITASPTPPLPTQPPTHPPAQRGLHVLQVPQLHLLPQDLAVQRQRQREVQQHAVVDRQAQHLERGTGEAGGCGGEHSAQHNAACSTAGRRRRTRTRITSASGVHARTRPRSMNSASASSVVGLNQ